MSALPLVITTAGLQALINASNTGVSNVVIAQLGVCPTQVAVSAATTSIPGEIKRLGAVAGQVVSEDTFYVSATDQSADTYAVRTIGLYLANGTLFAAYSQAAPLVEKAEPSMVVLEASVKLAAPLAGVLEFTGGGWLNPPASETVAGVLRLATVDEALAGANHSRAVTPKGLKAVRDAILATVQASIDALNSALAGKANTAHQHGAGDVTSGVFAEARIPDLGVNRITGLVSSLAGKAAAAHGHAMSEIAGLVSALALKAALDGPTFTGNVSIPSTNVIRKESAGGGEGGQLTLERPDVSTLVGNVVVDVNGSMLRVFEDGGSNRGFRLDLALAAGGAASTIWHTANFNPAEKAAASHSHDWAQVTGKPDLAIQMQAVRFGSVRIGSGNAIIYSDEGTSRLVLQAGAPGAERYFSFGDDGGFNSHNGPLRSQGADVWHAANFNPDDRVAVFSTNLGRTGAGPLVQLTRAAFAATPTGFSIMTAPNSEVAPLPTYGYILKHARRDNSNGWAGTWINFPGGGVPLRAFFGSAPDADTAPDWAEVWTNLNFNPADKAAAIHSHDWAQVTGKPSWVDPNAYTLVTGDKRFVTPVARSIHNGDADGGRGALEVQAAPGGAAYMTFHRPGYQAAYFGLDTDGNFRVGGASMGMQSFLLWHSANFNPADKAAAVHSHDWAQVTGKPAWVDPAAESLITGYKQFTVTGSKSIANGNDDGAKGAVEVRGNAGGAAYMTFHRPGVQAAFFGLDTDGEWKVGGWTMGSVSYRVWHAANFNPADKAAAVHSHDWSEVTGRPNLAVQDQTVRFASVALGAGGGAIYSDGGTNNVIVRTGAGGDFRFFSFGDDGAFNSHSGPVKSQGSPVWTEANFNPHAKANLSSPAFTDVPTAPTPAPGDNSTRLATTGFVQNAVSRATSSGFVDFYAGDVAPEGWLPANGAAISRTTYAALFAAIGVRFGAGDGSTTFNIPDGRGEFFRGWDAGRGVDPGRALGSWQDSQNREHQHDYLQVASADLFAAGTQGGPWTFGTEATSPSGGAEARSRNIAFLACIKI